MLLGKPREVYDWLVWVMCPFCPPIIVAEDPALSLACSTPMTPCEDPSRTVIGPFGSCAHPDPHDCGLEDPALSLARLTSPPVEIQGELRLVHLGHVPNSGPTPLIGARDSCSLIGQVCSYDPLGLGGGLTRLRPQRGAGCPRGTLERPGYHQRGVHSALFMGSL